MRQKDQKKCDAIRNASIELINTIGLAGISMSKVAKKAGVSPATIYVYFENKEDLLNQLYLMVKRELRDGILEGVTEDLEIEAAFKLVWKNLFHYAIAHADYFVFFEQFANSPLINHVALEQAQSYYRPLYELVERGKQEKIIKDLPHEILIAFSFQPIIHLAKGHLDGSFTLSEQDLSNVLELAWDAVTP